MPVLLGAVGWAEEGPGGPHRRGPEPIDVVVAQLTVTFRRTRSVRYGYRRSDPEMRACAPGASRVTTPIARTADTRTGKERRIDVGMPSDGATMGGGGRRAKLSQRASHRCPAVDAAGRVGAQPNTKH